MKNDRRKFLQISSTLAAGSLVLPNFGCGTSNSDKGTTDSTVVTDALKPSIDEFGIQLYTLRDDMPQDPKSVLKQLSSFGYKQIEGYEGEQGLFWGM